MKARKIIEAPQWLVDRMVAVRALPSPPLPQMQTQLGASALVRRALDEADARSFINHQKAYVGYKVTLNSAMPAVNAGLADELVTVFPGVEVITQSWHAGKHSWQAGHAPEGDPTYADEDEDDTADESFQSIDADDVYFVNGPQISGVHRIMDWLDARVRQ